MEARIIPTHAEQRRTGARHAQPGDEGFPGSSGPARPAGETASTHPYLGGWPAGPPSAPANPPAPGYGGRPEPAPGLAAAPGPPARGLPARAVIGDQIRRPILWCQMRPCITWHADPAALGEADNRSRAVAAGWRQDAFGRLACPACLQHSPEFRATGSVVPWDREHAVTVAALLAAVTGGGGSTAREAGARPDRIPVVDPAVTGGRPVRHARHRGKHHAPASPGPLDGDTTAAGGNSGGTGMPLPLNHVWDGITAGPDWDGTTAGPGWDGTTAGPGWDGIPDGPRLPHGRVPNEGGPVSPGSTR